MAGCAWISGNHKFEDGKLATIAFAVTFAASVLAWIVLLAGNGSLNAVCYDSCRYYFGLSWWVIWFQFIILLATIPVGILGIRSWRPAVLALLATNTALAMTQTDSWVQSKGLDPYYSLFTERINTLVAGYVMVSCLNVLLILVIGMSSDEGTKISVPQQSAYSNGPPPHTTPTYPSRG